MITYNGNKMTANQYAKEYVYEYGSCDYIWGMWQERVSNDVRYMTELEEVLVGKAIERQIDRVAKLFGLA